VLAGSVRAFSYAYTNDVIALEMEEPFASIVDSIVSIFHTSDADNIHTDLGTIKEVFFLLSRNGVLSSFDAGSDAMLSALTAKNQDGTTTVNQIIDTINSNERTKPIVTLITKISISVMAQQAGLDQSTIDTYENVKQGLNSNVLTIEKSSFATEEEYVSAVSDSLDQTLKENNITLEKDVVDSMAQYVSDNFDEVDEITDDQANDIILSYYDAYLEYQESGTVPDDLVPPELN
jgi:hypothetical protein